VGSEGAGWFTGLGDLLLIKIFSEMSNYLDNRSVRFNLEIIIADDNCSHVNKRSWRFKDRFEFLHDPPPPLGVILENEYLI